MGIVSAVILAVLTTFVTDILPRIAVLALLLKEEEDDLYRLLCDHRSSHSTLTLLFARIIARACLEPEHLWMCLGLENRAQLSALLKDHFRSLFEKNVKNMRWKKFFYKQLCEITDLPTCHASACEICSHYPECYEDVAA